MPVGNFQSANGHPVRVSVERKTSSGVFGRDFTSGGLRDYFSQVPEGLWVMVRCDVPHSNLGAIVRRLLTEKCGSDPMGMPETGASHLIVFLCVGDRNVSAEQLLSDVGERLSTSQVHFDPEIDRNSRIAKLRVEEQHLERELETFRSGKPFPRPSPHEPLHQVWTSRGHLYHRSSNSFGGDVELELANVQAELARLVSPSLPTEGVSTLGEFESAGDSSLTSNERDVLITVSVGSKPLDETAVHSLLLKGLIERQGIFRSGLKLTKKGKELVPR